MLGGEQRILHILLYPPALRPGPSDSVLVKFNLPSSEGVLIGLHTYLTAKSSQISWCSQTNFRLLCVGNLFSRWALEEYVWCPMMWWEVRPYQRKTRTLSQNASGVAFPLFSPLMLKVSKNLILHSIPLHHVPRDQTVHGIQDDIEMASKAIIAGVNANYYIVNRRSLLWSIDYLGPPTKHRSNVSSAEQN